jgi:hypothetical protein
MHRLQAGEVSIDYKAVDDIFKQDSYLLFNVHRNM